MELIRVGRDEFGRSILKNTYTNVVKSVTAWSISFKGDDVVQEQLAKIIEEDKKYNTIKLTSSNLPPEELAK